MFPKKKQSENWISHQNRYNPCMNTPRIAIVCDWLIDFWWAELVISHLLELYPNADIYTSVCFMEHPMLTGRNIYTSWIAKIPFINRRHKLAGILRPFAFRSFDFSNYDIIISSCSAEAKHAGYKKRGANTKHFCYCHTPTRYYWSHAQEYENMMEFGLLNPIARIFFRGAQWWMRKMDYDAAQRVDSFIANSKTTAERIKKYYHRDATIIYPGVDDAIFPLGEKKQDFYLWLGRCVPYKKMDLLVQTFNKNGKLLVLATSTDTPLYRSLKAQSKPNITWVFRPSDAEKVTLYTQAKAFLFPQEEDFWLVPIEAMMCGTPVIAYGKWWAKETVIDEVTGVFFDEQTPEKLEDALDRFEQKSMNPETLRNHGLEFSKKKFQNSISSFIG